MDKPRIALTFDAAVGFLPDGETVHTFVNPGIGMLVGADWDRAELLAAMRMARDIQVTGAMAQKMRHGLAIVHEGRLLYIETTRRTDEDEKESANA